MEQPRSYRAVVPAWLDVGVGLATAVLVLFGTVVVAARVQDELRPLDAAGFGLAGLVGLALAWRRRAPVGVLLVVVVLVAAYLLAGYPYGPVQICMVFAMFEVARLREFRVSLLACAAAVVAIVAALLFRAIIHADQPLLLTAVLSSWLVVPWLAGALVQVRAAATRRAREELAARAALEERMRVAGEVHDVAGHGFSAIAMQAGVALVVFDDEPGQAKESLEAIQATSTKALTDLRSMLDAFHRNPALDADPVDPVEPAAEGLRNVAALVENLRAAGLPVRVSAEPVTVSDQLDRVAYRVLQEALTNVLRHAGPTTAEVRVHTEPDVLVVEVLDRGVGAVDPRPGRGLTGMRHRVSAVGGDLVAEARQGGGFRVSARLPMTGRTT